MILQRLNVLGEAASHIYLELTKNFKNTGQIDFGVADISDYTIHLDLLRDLSSQKKSVCQQKFCNLLDQATTPLTFHPHPPLPLLFSRP